MNQAPTRRDSHVATPSDSERPLLPSATILVSDQRKPVVLIAEDSAQVQLMIRREFENRGWDVVAAMDGEAALKLGLDTPVDVAVLDIMMPGRTGPEVLYAWREAEVSFPVLILSAVQDEDRVIGLLELGAVDYVRKPFSTRELAVRVAHWLGV